jgi:hypothetical protein
MATEDVLDVIDEFVGKAKAATDKDQIGKTVSDALATFQKGGVPKNDAIHMVQTAINDERCPDANLDEAWNELEMRKNEP